MVAMLVDSTVDAQNLRNYATKFTYGENAGDQFAALMDGNAETLRDQLAADLDTIEQEEDEMAAMLEILQQLAHDEAQSMAPSSGEIPALPTISPRPTISSMPSSRPSVSPMPSVSMAPSTFPSISMHPSETSSETPTIVDTGIDTAEPTSVDITLPPFDDGLSPVFGGGSTAPVEPTNPPVQTNVPSAAPSISSSPSSAPSSSPSVSVSPTNVPTASPTVTPQPTSSPSASPSAMPSASPSFAPTSSPTLAKCGTTPEERSVRILSVLDSVANPISLRDPDSIQGKAADWLIGQDEYLLCPEDPKLVQRFALAVIYFATNGDDWLQCSADGTDLCGFEDPFVGDSRFLSADNECSWAGITCDPDMCVTEIEFELNNLVGTIPTEIALLKELSVWGMERGGLQGKIPTEIGALTKLTFLDLDYNKLTGSLSSELLSLSSLTQLDINDNKMTGSIDGIGVFPNMSFLQLHNNSFTGTVPQAVGTYSNLGAFTLHESQIKGVMPESVCDLLRTRDLGGVLDSLIADCGGLNPEIQCDCCTDCRL
jgi:hypothetical protein